MSGHITLGEQIKVTDRIRREHAREKQEFGEVLRAAVDLLLAGDRFLGPVSGEFIEAVLRVADQLAPPPDRGERMLRSLTAEDFPGHSVKA